MKVMENDMPDFRDKVKVKGAHAQRETAAALQVFADWERGDPRAIWFPKSQIDDDSEVWALGHEGELVVSEWIALQKGII